MSAPVSSRVAVPSFTIGKPSSWPGSRNEMKRLTVTEPEPPRAVLKCGRT